MQPLNTQLLIDKTELQCCNISLTISEIGTSDGNRRCHFTAVCPELLADGPLTDINVLAIFCALNLRMKF